MNKQNLTEEDKQKLIEFLNYVAEHAVFTHNTDGVVKYFKLLAHMQQVLLPKVEANILEIMRIVEPEKKQSKTSRKK